MRASSVMHDPEPVTSRICILVCNYAISLNINVALDLDFLWKSSG